MFTPPPPNYTLVLIRFLFVNIAERKIETCPGLLATLVAGRVHGELSGRLSMSEYFENQFMQFGCRVRMRV